MMARRWTFTGWAFAFSATAGVLLLGLIFHLDTRGGDQRERLETAKKDYDMVKGLRTRYRDLEIRKSKMPPDSDRAPQSWQVFLAQKAAEAGLPTPVIMPEIVTAKGPWKEHPFTVTLDAPSGSSVSRRNVVRFLELVESQRPGFKTKNIMFKFAGPGASDDFARASATFSQFER